MTLCRFNKIGSNLNYKGVIDCSSILPKIVLRYPSSQCSENHQEFSKIQLFAMNLRADKFDPVLKNIKENKEK